MANRIKEEEKNERIIRGLLKHPANKRCINCNSLGPQYVCTNFWTFICTNCSGLHREFTHRVKSISMAKFTSQEVIALQEGGNERAREVYFKEWDPQRHSYPDSSHLDRLRDFIKHVYLERRYAGGKNTDESPRVKAERADYDDHQRSNTDRSGGSRSPPYNDPYDRQFGGSPGSTGRSDDRNSHFNYEARSPGYDQGDHRSPSRSERRDEIHRYDKNVNNVQTPKSFNKISDELSKPGVSDNQKGKYESSPPMVRAVREILGGDIPHLKVGEFLKLNGGKASNTPLEIQGSTSNKPHDDGNAVELKRVNSVSLIDFSLDSEPLDSTAAKESFPLQTGSTLASSGGWASFDISSRQKASEAASTTGELESVFAQLSHSSEQVANSAISPPARSNSFVIATNGGQGSSMHQQPSFPVSSQSTSSPVHATIQQTSPFPSAMQGSTVVADGQSTRPVMHLSNSPTAFGNSQNAFKANANGRKELPADLFTGLYSTSPAPYPGWRMVPHHGMVYRVQYPVMMQPLTYGTAQQPLKYGAMQHPMTYDSAQQPATTFHSPLVSTNPFDLGNEPAPGLNPMINPSSASLQTAVRNPSNPLSLPQWTSPQRLSHPSSGLPGPYMMQQFPDDTPHHLRSTLPSSINPGAGVGNEVTPYSVSGSSELPARTNSNPFG